MNAEAVLHTAFVQLANSVKSTELVKHAVDFVDEPLDREAIFDAGYFACRYDTARFARTVLVALAEG